MEIDELDYQKEVKIPPFIKENWQNFVNLIAELLDIKAVLITKKDDEYLEILKTSINEDNPFQEGNLYPLAGSYCEKVIKNQVSFESVNELNIKWLNNDVIPAQLTSYLGFPIFKPDGSIFGTICVFDDQQKQFNNNDKKLLVELKNVIEDQLKYVCIPDIINLSINEISAIKNKYDSLLNLINEAVIINDLEYQNNKIKMGQITKFNTQTLDLLEYSSEELKKMTPLNLQANSLKKNLNNIFNLELLIKKGELTYETLYINKSNKKIPVEINSKIISFNNKKMVLSTIRDITDRKKAENKLKNQMKLTQTILDSLSSNIVVLDENGIIKYTNQAWDDYINKTDLNYQKNGLGMNYLKVFKKGDVRCLDKENAALEGIKEILEGRKTSFTLEYPCHYQDKKHWYKMKVTPFSGRENYSAVISNEEITEQKAREKELNEQKRYLESVIKTTMDGFIMLNECGEILEINDAFQQMTGYTNQELMNKHISIFDTTRPRPMIELYLDKIKNNQSERFETKIMDKNDDIIYVEISATYMSHLEEPIYFAFVRDITEKIKKRKEIKYYSYHDQMTDLYNRRYFEIQMERLNKSDHYPIAIIIGDLDGLKLVNDTYGHQQGDSYIKNMAEILKSVIREEDILARFGGDEFAILLEKANLQIAKKICERIKNKCRELSQKENLEIPLKISLGYHVEDNKKKDLFVGLNKADQNMYNNKGRSLRMKNKEKQKF